MKLTYEQAQELAKRTGYAELFGVGDLVETRFGHQGRITRVDAYGDQTIWGGWSCYGVDCVGGSIDFCDAHYTLGGCLKLIEKANPADSFQRSV